nr:transglutaminaseTgpA domain-containing protein [Oscillochloris sp. ZM17-4]
MLALGAALAPSIAATSVAFSLPAGLIGWAGALGLILGADLARPAGWRGWLLLRPVGAALLIVGGGAALLAAAGQSLPPLGLVAQDVVAALDRIRGRVPPDGGVWMSARFLQESLPRLWRSILAAPDAGRAGARLITVAVSVLGAWVGAIALGHAVAAGRPTLGWGMITLAAAGATAILGGGSGSGLLPAVGLILALAAATHAAALRRGWDRDGADYSDEIVPQLAAWGGLLIAMALLGSLAIPSSPPGWLSAWIWRDVALPSGIAAIEAQVQQPRPQPAPADVGLSQLPSLSLGQSLQQGPDGQVALRVSLGAPLAASPWPRYWRARVLDRYTGAGWGSTARVGAPVLPLGDAAGLPGGIAQEVEDLRPIRLTLIGLADILAADADARAERLPDGSLAALSADRVPARYRVLSRPPELAAAAPPDAPPPDMGVLLSLPARLPERVRELARSVAGDAASPYDTALALERYLRGLGYSYRVEPLPAGGDAVDQFLFEMRQGYCTYYASAMAIMARSLGIPARIAVGYAVGGYDPAGGIYTVREADAHAWPELYIGGRWLPFEPTPVRPLPARGGPTSPAPTPPPLLVEPPQPAVARAPWLALGGLVALAALLGAWLLWRRQSSPLARALLRLERRGARAGRPWPAGATLREYGDQLAIDAELITQIEAATYGGRPLSRRQEARLARAIDRFSRAEALRAGAQRQP